MISTDDAYVQADMSFVSPKISGYIDKVLVSENQKVKAGDPLFVIDNGDYKIAVAQAEAQIATLAKTLDRIDAQTKAAQASLSQAEAQKVADQAAANNAARAFDDLSSLDRVLPGRRTTLAQVEQIAVRRRFDHGSHSLKNISNHSVRFPLDMVLFPRYVNRQFEPNGSV
jgi:membrane fusion protein (multidrug efflux system)